MAYLTLNGHFLKLNGNYLTLGEDYVSLNYTTLYYHYNDVPVSTRTLSIQSNITWYITVDQSEITTAYVSTTSGTGNGSTDFHCGQNNVDNYDKNSDVKFYRTSDNKLMATCSMIEYKNGQ